MAETRLNDADRERIVAALRHHLGQERISLEEFEHRTGVVYTAASLEAAQSVLADLPAATPGGIVAGGRKRHAETTAARSHWHRTNEVFRDPSSGRVMRVWVDPETRARHYVAEA